MTPFFFDLFFCLKTAYRFRGYSPQPVTVKSVWRWLSQYPVNDRPLIKSAAKHLQYINAADFAHGLWDRNSALLHKLNKFGISNKNISYVSVGEAGSSSHMVLNLLRDKALLENLGCVLIDSSDGKKLLEKTTRLQSGAIIYVDDFFGTGNRCCGVRNFIGQFITGNFSEYFLLHTVCEEAIVEISKKGVTQWTYRIHEKRVRPMHESSTFLTRAQRDVLEALSQQCVKKKGALGFKIWRVWLFFIKMRRTGYLLCFEAIKGRKGFWRCYRVQAISRLL